MNILLSSHAFSPSIGGLEAVSLMLARELVQVGHEVVVITQTQDSPNSYSFPFIVIRRPSPRKLWQLIADADLVFHNHISLRAAWPMLFIHRPWVVTHQGWIPREGFAGVIGVVKRFVLRWATEISISDAVAADFKSPSVVIRNPYDANTFHEIPGVRRNKELVFVGRFVSDKGLQILLHALEHLGRSSLRPCLTVVGEGPEEVSWRCLIEELDLSTQVKFVGVKMGKELAEVLNAHKVLVVPSLWNEPFGVVALEGMACGCLVVGSEGGGLKEAIGPGGLTFPNGNVEALASCIRKALFDAETGARCRLASPTHLNRHLPGLVTDRYLEVFSNALKRLDHWGNG